jgi:hypothetical protein
MDLQSHFGSDDRFRMDSRFLESDSEEEQEGKCFYCPDSPDIRVGDIRNHPVHPLHLARETLLLKTLNWGFIIKCWVDLIFLFTYLVKFNFLKLPNRAGRNSIHQRYIFLHPFPGMKEEGWVPYLAIYISSVAGSGWCDGRWLNLICLLRFFFWSLFSGTGLWTQGLTLAGQGL